MFRLTLLQIIPSIAGSVFTGFISLAGIALSGRFGKQPIKAGYMLENYIGFRAAAVRFLQENIISNVRFLRTGH